MEQPKFLAKILLFGEHTILRGSKALAVPFSQRYCYWSWEEKYQDTSLSAFAIYLEKTLPLAFDVDEFKLEIHQGLRLHSNIPNGYGLGSSGAVCVAIFQRFSTSEGRHLAKDDPKAFFGKMEGFFHGSSSGVDPLIIYLNQNLCLLANGDYQVIPLQSLTNSYQFFLLDTEQQRKTAPLVNRFTERYDSNEFFKKMVDENWSKPTDHAIDSLLNNDMTELWSAFEKISSFQYQHLQEWITPRLLTVWGESSIKKTYLLKICGAGGGGYCLGLTKNWTKTQEQLSDFSLIPFDVG